MNRAARAVLPAYSTTPIPALLRETGWGPAKLWLDRLHDRLAIRIAAADPSHPLRRRWTSRRFEWVRQRLDLDFADAPLQPPWLRVDRSRALEEIGATGRDNGLDTFKSWLQALPPLDLVVYSDGSADEHRRAGAGYVVFRGTANEIARGQVSLGSSAEVFDAEIAGALNGLHAALLSPMAYYATNVTVVLDNQEAALCLHTGRPPLSMAQSVLEFQRVRFAWTTRDRGPSALTPGKVYVRWCPGHMGITGNEIADVLAKAACAMAPTEPILSRARPLYPTQDAPVSYAADASWPGANTSGCSNA